MQSERNKLTLLCLLLLLMLGIVAFTAVNTVEAIQNLRRQYNDVKSGDVSAVDPWMTIHVVSHLYNVPENYLYHSLQITYPNEYRHTTLYELASHKKQPVNQVIRIIQHAILTYRKEHPRPPTPVSSQGDATPKPGRHY